MAESAGYTPDADYGRGWHDGWTAAAKAIAEAMERPTGWRTDPLSDPKSAAIVRACAAIAREVGGGQS